MVVFGPSCEGGDAPLLENVFLPRGSNRWRWTTSDRGDQQRRSGEREASHPTEKGSGRVRWNGAEIRAWQLLFLSSAENTLLEGALGVVRGAGRALGCTRPRARGTRGLRSAGARRRWRRFGRIRWRAERIFFSFPSQRNRFSVFTHFLSSFSNARFDRLKNRALV